MNYIVRAEQGVSLAGANHIRLTSEISHTIQMTVVFSHLERSRNTAGLLLEQRKINEKRWKMMSDFNRLPAIMPAMLYA